LASQRPTCQHPSHLPPSALQQTEPEPASLQQEGQPRQEADPAGRAAAVHGVLAEAVVTSQAAHHETPLAYSAAAVVVLGLPPSPVMYSTTELTVPSPEAQQGSHRWDRN
jgi:hypothetical protein